MAITITSRREKNDRQSHVSRSKIRFVDGTPSIQAVESAVLNSLMYDATTIVISGVSSIDLSDLWLELSEVIGEERRTVSFNMLTRLSENGEDRWNERIFYSDKFTVDSDTGNLELTIYVPAASTDGNEETGYSESVVMVSFERLGEDHHVIYRTNLPPFIINGIPFKRNPNESDSVLPDSASRVDFGVDTVPSYYENSLNIDRDYLFTNSAPVYTVVASGYLPEKMVESYEFQNVSAFMRNPNTGMTTFLRISDTSDNMVSLETMSIDGSNDAFSASIELHTWQYDLISESFSACSGSIYSTAGISGALIERDINN